VTLSEAFGFGIIVRRSVSLRVARKHRIVFALRLFGFLARREMRLLARESLRLILKTREPERRGVCLVFPNRIVTNTSATSVMLNTSKVSTDTHRSKNRVFSQRLH